jgi:hypothetical protein
MEFLSEFRIWYLLRKNWFLVCFFTHQIRYQFFLNWIWTQGLIPHPLYCAASCSRPRPLMSHACCPASSAHVHAASPSSWYVFFCFVHKVPPLLPDARPLPLNVSPHRLNMKLVSKVYFCFCVRLYSLAETPPLPLHLDSFTRALLVSKDRRHLFVTPCLSCSQRHPILLSVNSPLHSVRSPDSPASFQPHPAHWSSPPARDITCLYSLFCSTSI